MFLLVAVLKLFSECTTVSGGDTHIPEKADGKKKRQKGGLKGRLMDKQPIACQSYIFTED